MNIDLPENLDLNNAEFQNVWNLVQHTRQSVFLTGKAGTGKSTFLKYICANTSKKYVVLAPTGIAAVNVGGQTLHSFFKIPFKPLLPDDPDFAPRQIRKTQRYPKDKVNLLKSLELIIIDEISMVRADIIDFIDKILKIYSGNMREPFGGKQLLFVGDIFQLEPVVTRDMREILGRFYKQFFFFNARVFADLGLVPIELRKVYRQNDAGFISLLDRVRVGHTSAADMAMLNSRCGAQQTGEFAMTIATRRDTVDSINDEHMAALKTPEFTFTGVIDGDFPENDLPTAKDLQLKVGAQVIFIRNDKDNRWVNGTIGKISSLEGAVKVELEDGVVHQVEEEVWENMQYSFDEKKNIVVEKILGSFQQYPIKPAWALTVHKSQGLTFNNITIDFSGGAFSSGQTYVALSRCTAIEGITLLKPLSERDIIVNMAVVLFSQQFNNQNLVNGALKQEEANVLYRRAAHAFDHFEFQDAIDCFLKASEIKPSIHNPAVQRLIARKLMQFNKLNNTVAELKKVINEKDGTLHDLAQEYTLMGSHSITYAVDSNKPLDEIAIKSAFANFNKALRICPDFYEAHAGKAKLYVLIDEQDTAEEEFKKALEINCDCYEAHLGLASLYREQKKISSAIKSFKRAIKADKKKWEPHYALAEIYDNLDLDDLSTKHRNTAQKLQQAANLEGKKSKTKKRKL
ncbi:AAA family ATPase [Sodaliphilus sp.]|uniref:AAA family ATPase n=1 Tax=Sodaliphilus sp. TaxID=2815818 RepID=UPI003890A336